MKSISFFGILPLLALIFSPFSILKDGTTSYQVNTSESVVNWKAEKVTGSHAGTINLKNGKLDFTDGVLTGGSFDLDMSTIVNTDQQGEWKAKLEGHLSSPDFFNIQEFPVANFVITRSVPKGTPGDYKVTGNLTIKGITKEIKFYTNVVEKGNQLNATADITIDRTDFDIRYGSGSFFDNLGDKTIYDEFFLTVQLVANK